MAVKITRLPPPRKPTEVTIEEEAVIVQTNEATITVLTKENAPYLVAVDRERGGPTETIPYG